MFFMRGLFVFVRKKWEFFCSEETWSGPPKESLTRWTVLLLGGWFLFWSLLPIAILRNDYIDILENIVWGSHFQFGYDKNPYVGAWIGYASWFLTGDTWISYGLSQVFVTGGFIAVYLTARKMLPPLQSLLSVVMLWGISPYCIKAAELCDDVMELGFWPWTVFFFYQALRSDRKILYWILTGVFAGLSFMVKYYGAVLLVSMFSVLLFTKEGRASFKTAGPYLAFLAAFLISLPNFLWLYCNNFVAFDYAIARASLGESSNLSWWNHISNPWRLVVRSAGVVAVPLGFFFLCFFQRSRELPPEDGFNRRFIGILCWGPFAATLLFSLLTGGFVIYAWVIPCFLWTGVFTFLFYRPRITRTSVRVFLSLMIGMALVYGVIYLFRSTLYQGYRKNKCDYENYPGRRISDHVTEEWRKRTGRPLKFVVGERKESCNTAVYSADRPEAYFSANPSYSQWIDEKELRRHGGVILFSRLWRGIVPDPPEHANLNSLKPRWLDRLQKDGFNLSPMYLKEFPRAVPAWFTVLAGEPKKEFIAYCFILPEK